MKRYLLLTVIATACLYGLFKLNQPKAMPHWMQQQISADLSTFSNESFSPKIIAQHFKKAEKNERLVHFQIQNNHIYYKRNWSEQDSDYDRLRKMAIFLYRVSKQYPLEDADFIMTVSDGLLKSTKNLKQTVPIFCFAKHHDLPGILIPDPLSESFSRRKIKKVSKAKKLKCNLWRNKVEVAFWRGSPTGKGAYTLENWQDFPRSQLCLISKAHQSDIDAGFSFYNKMQLPVKEMMSQHIPLLNWANYQDHLKYKYLVIADGNTCTYPRFLFGLYSGSVVFKDHSDDIQWFYSALKPGHHYIQVNQNFSDLVDKVHWAQTHDKEAQKIASYAEAFVKENLSKKHIYRYCQMLIKSYSEQQKQDFRVKDDMILCTGSHKNKW